MQTQSWFIIARSGKQNPWGWQVTNTVTGGTRLFRTRKAARRWVRDIEDFVGMYGSK